MAVNASHALFTALSAKFDSPRPCLSRVKTPTLSLSTKSKGNKTVYGNCRSISLVAAAWKIRACILLARLPDAVTEIILPELQSSLRRSCGTIDVIFVARPPSEEVPGKKTTFSHSFP